MELEILEGIQKIRQKIKDKAETAKDVRFNKNESILMEEAYRQILKSFGLKRNPPKNCNACNVLVKTINNYFNSIDVVVKQADDTADIIKEISKGINEDIKSKLDLDTLEYSKLHELAKSKGFEGKKRSRKNLINYINNK